jgi:hypothetical protein
MSKLEVDAIEPQSGTTLTIGASGDTIIVPAGTVSLPAITTTGDTNTGIFFPAADTIAFTEGGAEAMRIDSSGRVGIGTTSPSANLEVRGASSNGQIYLGGSTTATYGKFYSDNDGTLIASADAGNNAASSYFGVEVDGTERMRITSGGQVLIGMSSFGGSATDKVAANIPSDDYSFLATQNLTAGAGPHYFAKLYANNASLIGSIRTTNTATSFNTSSDYRLKENVNYNFDATTRLKQLKPARFNFISDENTIVDGFIAHEVQNIIPEAITGEKDKTETKEKVVSHIKGYVIAQNIEQADWEAGKIPNEEGVSKYPIDSIWDATKEVPVYQGIDQSKLTPLLTKALQEAIAKIEQLEAKVTALENA